jgi:uncharacterized membrane protein YccC
VRASSPTHAASSIWPRKRGKPDERRHRRVGRADVRVQRSARTSATVSARIRRRHDERRDRSRAPRASASPT